MTLRRHKSKPGKRLFFIKASQQVTRDTPKERAAKDKLIAKFVRKHGVTKCPPASV